MPQSQPTALSRTIVKTATSQYYMKMRMLKRWITFASTSIAERLPIHDFQGDNIDNATGTPQLDLLLPQVHGASFTPGFGLVPSRVDFESCSSIYDAKVARQESLDKRLNFDAAVDR